MNEIDENKIEKFQQCFRDAFAEIAKTMSETDFELCENIQISEERKFSVIVGAVGKCYKGRVLFQAGAAVVKQITEGMNGEPVDNTMDTYLYIAEFANTFCGNAITRINNMYKESEFRLTPPAILAGTGTKITTPSIETRQIFFRCNSGQAILDVGFEGA